jgi:hypothetical protein
MNNNMFFSSTIMNGNDALIEPMNTVAMPDTSNSFLKQDFTSNSATTTTTTTTAINNLAPTTNNTQQTYQTPVNIAPFPPQFQGFDLSTLPSTNKPVNAATIATVKSATVASSVATGISMTNTPKSNTPAANSSETIAASAIAVSPSAEQNMIAQPIAPTSSTLARIRSRSKVTGENVTANNFEEGYVQFVLSHDANFIHDGIESLIYAKRKFQSVPKTGDLHYTTWDIYQLVVKLQHQEVIRYNLPSFSFL